MSVYYNDNDKHIAAWLRELIKLKRIPNGVVDERDIREIEASELKGFRQCHFFAGIGGWAYALRLAEVSCEFNIWTASLPCQPFSSAGKQLGKNDERHFLPQFINLVRQCRPQLIFGEQVENAIKHGWIDDLHAEMERENYTTGFSVLGAHSVNAPQKRQRLYWFAYPNRIGCDGRGQTSQSET